MLLNIKNLHVSVAGKEILKGLNLGGNEGELFKKRQSLMAPIQDEIYNAVKDISDQKGYQLVLDRASGGSIIYASPKIDISDEVLLKLGYAH